MHMKSNSKNIHDLPFFLEKECTGVCGNWAGHYTQTGDIINQPIVSVHIVLTLQVNEKVGKNYVGVETMILLWC